MEFLVNIFNILLYQPLFNALILLYQFIPGKDFGIAIIILTILIKIIFYPLTTKSIKSQKKLNELQFKIQEVQQKFKEDKEKQVREIMEIYKREKITPLSGCFPLLVQMPVLIALFYVFIRGFSQEQMAYLYDFIPHPETISLISFGIINLEQSNIFIAILAGIAQFFQSKMLISNKTEKDNKKEKNHIDQISNIMQKQMIYFMPIFTTFVLLTLPSAMGFYWLTVALFSIWQQKLVLKTLKHQN